MPDRNLLHFVNAQTPIYSRVVEEIKNGCKQSHWMWFVFPQIAGLGRSAMAQRYAIRDLDQAKRYLTNPILGPRLREVLRLMMKHKGKLALEILGSPDDLKFRSCLTLFREAASEQSDRELFTGALKQFYGSEPDSRTLELLGMAKLIGILAYGSLIGRPGPEIEPEIVSRRHNILTPFRVEFVRASKTRGGAPTLVPVSNGGSAVLAQILLLDLPEQEVKDRLWRRETNRVGQGGHYRHQKNPGPDTLIIDRHNNLAGVDIVFSARFAANIASPSPKRLAELLLTVFAFQRPDATV